MILNNNGQEVQTNLTNASKEFTIKTTAKAFRILSSGLYSDRIKAIIRELSCNAWDAHATAKNNEPFLVHLPSSLEPWFSVRDYGIGLSEDDVMNLYSTYFESTKTDSNDQIGALGLGSKSPFSYTDSFNVISNWGDKSKSYTAFIDKNGTPSIIKVHEEDSTEHVGLEIKFAVNKDDFDEFAQKAGVVFRIFKTKPKVIGSSRYSNYEQTLTKILGDEGWNFYKTSFYTSDRAVALQGNIEYPIDVRQLGTLDEGQEFIAENKFYIDFAIGDLDISASRESLGYDEVTVANIKTALSRVYDSFIAKFNSEIQSAKTLWDAFAKAYQLSSDVGLNHWQRDKLSLSWKNRKFKLGEELEYVLSRTPDFDSNKEPILGSGIIDKKLSVVVYRRESSHSSGRVSRVCEYVAKDNREVKITVHPYNQYIFVVNDEPSEGTRPTRKVRQIAKSNRGVSIYFLSEMSKKFFKAIGNPTFILTSSVELEKKTSNGKTYSTPENYYGLCGSGSNEMAYDELEEELDTLDGNFYILKVRDDYIGDDGKEYNKSDIEGMYKLFVEKEIIGKDKSLVAVKRVETEFKRFKELKWIPFISWAKANLEKYINDNAESLRAPIIAEQRKKIIENKISYSVRKVMLSEYKNNVGDYLENSCFINIAKTIHDAQSSSDKYRLQYSASKTISDMAAIFGINLAKDLKFNESEVDYTKAYPMIEFCSSYSFEDKFKMIKAYIILMDKSRQEV